MDIDQTTIFTSDLLDCVNLCAAALEPDAPQRPEIYLNSVRTMLYAYLTKEQREACRAFIQDKEYKPAPQLVLPDKKLVT
mgnify:FL=1|jgi:hypothetical protein